MITLPFDVQHEVELKSRDEAKAQEQGIQDVRLSHLVSTELLALFPIVTHTPSEILLGYLRDGRLRVVSPFKVRFVKDGDQVIAEAEEINEFGFGSNAYEALLDLQRAIAELYFALLEEQDRLGSDLEEVWRALQQKLKLLK
ncbi:MAG: hypothetical protein ACE5HK_00580 [Candidatus Methylomirabilales bacterium]